MIIIGLTGGIAMGKSTVAKQLSLLGVRVICADAIVHRLLAKQGKAIPLMERHFPACVMHGAVDRGKLGRYVFENPEKLRLLESLLHPLVRKEEERLIHAQRRLGAKAVALDIPLLLEADTDLYVDYVMVASAPAFLQRQRALARPGMTAEKLRGILERQWPDAKKRRYSDVVILTGLGRGYSMQQVKAFMDAICVR